MFLALFADYCSNEVEWHAHVYQKNSCADNIKNFETKRPLTGGGGGVYVSGHYAVNTCLAINTR